MEKTNTYYDGLKCGFIKGYNDAHDEKEHKLLPTNAITPFDRGIVDGYNNGYIEYGTTK